MSRKEAGVSRNPWFNKYSGIAGVEEVDDDDEEEDDVVVAAAVAGIRF